MTKPLPPPRWYVIRCVPSSTTSSSTSTIMAHDSSFTHSSRATQRLPWSKPPQRLNTQAICQRLDDNDALIYSIANRRKPQTPTTEATSVTWFNFQLWLHPCFLHRVETRDTPNQRADAALVTVIAVTCRAQRWARFYWLALKCMGARMTPPTPVSTH